MDEPHEAFSKIVAILLTEWRRAYQPAADYKSVDNEQVEKKSIFERVSENTSSSTFFLKGRFFGSWVLIMT